MMVEVDFLWDEIQTLKVEFFWRGSSSEWWLIHARKQDSLLMYN